MGLKNKSAKKAFVSDMLVVPILILSAGLEQTAAAYAHELAIQWRSVAKVQDT